MSLENAVVRRLRVRCLLASLLVVPLACIAQSADVTLDFSKASKAVVADFVLSEPVQALRFRTGGQVRKKTWALPAGASLGADGNSIIFRQPTQAFSVGLGAFSRDGEVDRVYSPVIAFGDGDAALVYTEYLLPTSGGAVKLRPGGVHDGDTVQAGGLAWRPNDADGYLLLGRSRTQDAPAFKLTMDQAAPAWAKDWIAQVAMKTLAYYEARLGPNGVKKPWLVASFTEAEREGAFFRGDTSGGAIRLNLMGRGWQLRSAANEARLSRFVAHELFHLWNGHAFHADERQEWLLEGGADAAAHEALVQTGLLSPALQQQYVEEGFIRCAMARGNTLGQKLSGGGRLFYDCGGAVFHLAGRLGTPADQPPVAALWAGIFALAGESRAYSAQTLLAAVRAPDERALAMLSGLLDSKATWAATLDAEVPAFGLRRSTPEDLKNPAIAESYLNSFVIAAVRQDCRGAMSVSYDNLVFQIDALPSCELLKTSFDVTRVEGLVMADNPPAAAAAAMATCASQPRVALADGKGRSIAFACEALPRAPGTFVLPRF